MAHVLLGTDANLDLKREVCFVSCCWWHMGMTNSGQIVTYHHQEPYPSNEAGYDPDYITACSHVFVSRRSCYNSLGILTSSQNHVCHLKKWLWWPLHCCKCPRSHHAMYFFMLSCISMCTAHRDSDEEEETTRSSVLCDTEAYMSSSNMEYPDADIWFPSISFPVLCDRKRVRATLPWCCQVMKGNLTQPML